MKRDPFEYGIVLLPDVQTCIDAVAMNRRVAHLASDPPIVLGLTEDLRRRACDNPAARAIASAEKIGLEQMIPGSWPHISLIHKAARPAMLGHVVDAVQEALKLFGIRELVGGFTSYVASGQFIFRMVADDERLAMLHLAVAERVAAVDPDCKMPLPDDLEGRDMEEWNRYGWLYAGRNYRPHLTVGHMRVGETATALDCLPGAKRDPQKRNMVVDYWSSRTIGIGRLGPHGTVPELIATIALDGLLVR